MHRLLLNSLRAPTWLALCIFAATAPDTLRAAPIRILPFGESTTDGGGTESYRKKLGDQLTAAGIAFDFIGSLKRPNPATWDSDHQGMSGNANIDLNNWMNAHGASYQADIVLLWQGTNDCGWGWQYYGQPLDSLSALIDRICEKQPGAEVFVSSIPMMGPNAYPESRGPGEANAAATAYNNAMPALIASKQAQGKKVHFVDTRGVLQVSDLMGDGIHPTQAGYDKMVPHWFAAIQPFLTPDDSPPTLSGNLTATALLNSPFSYTILASGLPTAFGATGLPPGLALDPATGIISGTPTAQGVSIVTLSATNANGTGTADLTLTVSDEEAIYAQDFVEGTTDWFAYSGDAGVSHDFTVSANGPDASSALNLDVTVAPSAPYWYAGLGVTIATPVPFTPTSLASTFLSFDVYAGTAGSPTITIDVKTPGNNGTLRHIATVTGNAWTTISVPLSAFTDNNFDYTAGSYQILIAPAGAGWPNTSSTSRVDNLLLNRAVLAPAAPVISGDLTAVATIDRPFTYTITANGQPTSFGATGLPAGLTLDPATGIISGIPTTLGTTFITLGAINAHGTGTATLALTVSPPGQVIYADSLASNTYFWGLASWANAGGSLNFANGHLSYDSSLSPYVATYGPSGLFPWDGGYGPLPNFSPLFALGNRVAITFEARASSPNGINGLTLEAAASYDPHNLYAVTTPALTHTWTTHAFTSVSVIGTPDPARITALALTTGGTNLGTVDVRNIRIEALLDTPTTLSPLQSWSVTHFGTSHLTGDTAPHADFDGDGLSNLLEYALGSDPVASSATQSPQTEILDSKLQLNFLRARADITYEVLATSDLSAHDSWEVIATNPGEVSATVPVTVTDPESVSENPRRFLRLRVTL